MKRLNELFSDFRETLRSNKRKNKILSGYFLGVAKKEQVVIDLTNSDSEAEIEVIVKDEKVEVKGEKVEVKAEEPSDDSEVEDEDL